DVQHDDRLVYESSQDECRAHPPALRVLLLVVEQAAVHFHHQIAQVLFTGLHIEEVFRSPCSTNFIQHEFTGHVTILVAAHAVRNHDQELSGTIMENPGHIFVCTSEVSANALFNYSQGSSL